MKEALALDYRPVILVPGAGHSVRTRNLIGCHSHCSRPDHVLNFHYVTLGTVRGWICNLTRIELIVLQGGWNEYKKTNIMGLRVV